jgi:HD-GYP domain-containing protein (c-di-GMP phosphodiesterase class II)
LISPEKEIIKASSIELIATVGLMLDLDRNVQLYHAWRVATLGYHLAQRLATFEAPLVFMAGMLADCGAVRFKRHIVHELLDQSAVVGQKASIHLFFHPIVGYEVVRRIPGMRRVAQLVRQHHECYNGTGYPDGLAGRDIDVGVQILRLADQFDLTLRADQPASLKEMRASLAPMANEDYSKALLTVLEEILEGELGFGRLLQDDKVIGEVENICTSLSGLKMFETAGDWERALEAIGELIDTRNDLYTSGMSGRVATLSTRVAARLGFSESEQRLTRWASYLQNMGEVSLRRDVLSKSQRLEDSERKLIRYHPILSHNLISRVTGLAAVSRIVRHHHENYDGSGYPEGLAMEEIPMPARILRAADSYFAMTSNRPYQRKRDFRQAFKELRRQRGKQFDPNVVDAMLLELESA